MTGIVAVLVSVTPIGANFEEEWGLRWLFQWRGQQPQPAEVVVIAVDKDSTESLNLPQLPRKWSRGVYADILNRLEQAQPALVTFDFIFSEARLNDQSGDTRFAQAIAAAGNVFLYKQLALDIKTIRSFPLQDREQTVVEGVQEQLISPLEKFSQGALGSGPFPLPRVPTKVSQFWTFKKSVDNLPTVVSLALQAYLWPFNTSLDDLMRRVDPGWRSAEDPQAMSRTAANLSARVKTVRTWFEEQPQRQIQLLNLIQAGSFSQEHRRALGALVALYGGYASHYFNFYGPPRSITTIPLAQVLQDKVLPESLRQLLYQKVVYVGLEEPVQPMAQDDIETVFSQDNGLHISGVELMATAFANLQHSHNIRPAPVAGQLLLLFLWPLSVALLLRALPLLLALVSVSVLSLAVVAGIYGLFVGYQIWYPLAIPLVLALPLTLVLSILWRQCDTQKERNRIKKAFGYYIPDHMVDKLAQSAKPLGSQGQLVYGVCLATDAEKYTTLAETLAPQHLKHLMNDYYAHLFKPVMDSGGFISDVVGDAVLALWANPEPHLSLKSKSCHAALAMFAANAVFNRKHAATPIETRIGIHSGEMMMGNVGALDHFEYRAVGDIVNTANRLQSLNKILKTRILVSADTRQQQAPFLFRDLGEFVLRGKTKTIRVYELIAELHQATPAQQELCEYFETAITRITTGDYAQAFSLLETLASLYPQDGPTQYYLQYCRDQINSPHPTARNITSSI